jgi:hypothetical protein
MPENKPLDFDEYKRRKKAEEGRTQEEEKREEIRRLALATIAFLMARKRVTPVEENYLLKEIGQEIYSREMVDQIRIFPTQMQMAKEKFLKAWQEIHGDVPPFQFEE